MKYRVDSLGIGYELLSSSGRYIITEICKLEMLLMEETILYSLITLTYFLWDQEELIFLQGVTLWCFCWIYLISYLKIVIFTLFYLIK